jgi:hypothetical protein
MLLIQHRRTQLSKVGKVSKVIKVKMYTASLNSRKVIKVK